MSSGQSQNLIQENLPRNGEDRSSASKSRGQILVAAADCFKENGFAATSIDDVADMLQRLPDQVIQEILSAMTEQNRARIEAVLSYEKDTAGGLMNMDVITVRPRFTLDVVLRYLRRHDVIPPSTDQLIVVNQHNVFLGTLSMSKLLTSDPAIFEAHNSDVVVSDRHTKITLWR